MFLQNLSTSTLKLRIYIYVIYRVSCHKKTATVIATSKLSASEIVQGTVMHVSEPVAIRNGKILANSGWNLDFHKATYSEPSESWLNYLKKINLNVGFEDTTYT